MNTFAKFSLPRLLRRNDWLPVAAIATLALLALILGFNGLYGQDAHEYLRLSRAYFQQFQGVDYLPVGRGDVEFAVGYPLTGALLHWLIPDAAQALQLVSLLSAGLALWGFDANLRVLSPGAHRWSRQLCTAVALAGSAYFVRAGLTVMSDALGLALTLGAFRYGLRAVEWRHGRDAVWAAGFAGLAILTRFSLIALLLPLAAGILWSFRQRPQQWGWLALAAGVGLLTLLPHFILKMPATGSPLDHSLLQDWSLLHLFHAEFTTVNGTVDYGWPNLLYVLFPLAHPGFFLPLPLLFLLTKRTDFLLPSKRVLLACLAVYLLFLGGISHQNLRYLLPAYALLLLLLFPAWDRFVSYGFYFFKRLTYGLLAVAVALQVIFTVRVLAPVVARNRLERVVAREVGRVMGGRGFLPGVESSANPSPLIDPTPDPSPGGEGSLLITRAAPLPGGVGGGVLFAFDLDVALKSYLPNLDHRNLWAQRYDEFPPGSYLLFNEPRLRHQWAGQNPMLNWDFAVAHYDLRAAAQLPEGWTLYEVVKSK